MKKETEDDRMSRIPNRPARRVVEQGWPPFLAVATVLVLLCQGGGRIGYPGSHPINIPGLNLLTGGDPRLPAGWFILLFGVTWAACLAAILFFPRRLNFRAGSMVILILAVVCRLPLLSHPSSDDVNRYLWEGRLLAEGFSPYRHPPQSDHDPVVDYLRDKTDPIWAGINHPRMTAIYPPLTLGGLALLASIAYSPLAWKAVIGGFDLATLLLILSLLHQRCLNLRWALLYAVNPVILYGFAGQGHLDVIGQGGRRSGDS